MLKCIYQYKDKNWFINFFHAYKEANSCADRLVTKGMAGNDSFVLLANVPDLFKEFLVRDIQGLMTFDFVSNSFV